MLYDVFICHASEDKDSFVRPLAERLRDAHIEVWYDEFSLSVGDSLRQSIDRGLSQSRYGIVVLSPHFFEKRWSQWELNGLVARHMSGDAAVILPLWHQVDRDDVLGYSPSIADMVAIPTSLGLDEVIRRLDTVIHPKGSTLIIARDRLLAMGVTPPVISDDWWLDIAGAAESNDVEGTFQEAMGWGRWGFPLPERSKEPTQRGWRLASAALQQSWMREANERPITQITHPDEILSFIESQPGLRDACDTSLEYLLAYAPQLGIRGFGGMFEDRIEGAYQRSVEHSQQRRARGEIGGTGLTGNGSVPGCDDEFALRDPNFGGYRAAHVACGFVQGNDVAGGPQIKYYEFIDYIAWLLSSASTWLTPEVRAVLTTGMAEWGVWHWFDHDEDLVERFGFQAATFTGALFDALDTVRTDADITFGSAPHRDLVHRLGFSAKLLGLPEAGNSLAAQFLASGFVGTYHRMRAQRGT